MYSGLKRLVDCRHYSRVADAARAMAALAPGAVPVPLTGGGLMSAGLGDGDLFDLNKRGNLIRNLWGVGDGTGVGVGLGDTLAFIFLWIRLGVRGAAAGVSAGDGDPLVSTGEVVSVLFSARCFGGEGDSGGVPVNSCDRTCATQIVRPSPSASGRILRLITSTCLCSRLS